MNTVYGVIMSPFVRKVLMVLEHKGVEYTVEPVMPMATAADYNRIHPLRKVPAFRDPWVQLADSSVICDYLENRYSNNALYPSDPADRARALWFEEYADTRLAELLGGGYFLEKLMAPLMLQRATDWAKVKATEALLPAEFDYLDTQLDASGALVGGCLSIADLSVASVFLNARYAGLEVCPASWPKLAKWLAELDGHPLFAKRIEEEKALLKMLKGE